EARLVRSAARRTDAVDKRVEILVIAGIVLEGDIHLDAFRGAAEQHDVVERALALRNGLHHLGDPFLRMELRRSLLTTPTIDQTEMETRVEIRHLPETSRDRVEVEIDRVEDRRIRLEVYQRATALRFADHLERSRDHPAREFDPVALPVPIDDHDHPFGECVHHTHAHAMQTTRDLVRRPVELAAGMEHRKSDLNPRLLLLRVDVDRDPAAVVLDGNRSVRVNDNLDICTEAGYGLVDRVVDDLPDQVVQTALAGGADVHAGPLPYGLESLQNG